MISEVCELQRKSTEMPQVANQTPFQPMNSTISSQRAANMILTSTMDRKAKTNFSIDWIVQNHKEGSPPPPATSLPNCYDSEICNALRLPVLQNTLQKTPTKEQQMQSAIQHSITLERDDIKAAYDKHYFDRITPEASPNDVQIPLTDHNPQPLTPQYHHSSHQRPAPYRPIPFPHANYPHSGPNHGTHQTGAPGPIRSGGSVGGMPEPDLVVAQLHFLAAMQRQQHQFTSMQHPPAHLPQLPPGHPHNGIPPNALMYAQNHLAPPQFHNESAIAYPLAPWLINRHGRLMARPFSHGRIQF